MSWDGQTAALGSVLKLASARIWRGVRMSGMETTTQKKIWMTSLVVQEPYGSPVTLLQ